MKLTLWRSIHVALDLFMIAVCVLYYVMLYRGKASFGWFPVSIFFLVSAAVAIPYHLKRKP